jgi:hypothetical protein
MHGGGATHQLHVIWAVWVTLADASNGVPGLRFYFSVTALSKNRNRKKMFATDRNTRRRMQNGVTQSNSDSEDERPPWVLPRFDSRVWNNYATPTLQGLNRRRAVGQPFQADTGAEERTDLRATLNGAEDSHS